MSYLRIALMPGDGIGPEVTDAAVQVLQDLEAKSDDLVLRFETLAAGAGEYLNSGNPLPPGTLERARDCDAILLGAMGLPDVRWPNGTEMAPQIDIREHLDLYQGVRPVRLYHDALTPLRGKRAGEIDLVIYRESTEGLFWGRRASHDPQDDYVENVLRISRRSSERIVEAAFAAARRRRGKVALVDKANVLPAMAFFRQVFDQIAASHPDIATERVHVDAAALFLVQQPERFDVIVTENMFGVILSDLAAGIVGGMGMAPSADIGTKHAVFQPAHGSAPDIARRDTANPLAAILSAALMLDWLGREAEGNTIRGAVAATLQDPACRTADLGGRMSCAQLRDEVISRL
ncbi:MAG: isocitrate/isopropylmalate family dehydrogenase [Bryobacterales bacterium]|nr:isocitrate/isopropylmalate family dehydrogenase [Bryobacterales bacterium]